MHVNSAGADRGGTLTLTRALPMEKALFKEHPPWPTRQPTPRSFQEIILRLQSYWAAQGLRRAAAL